jgi:processive 1,2-diacylglycerol beta-glucosyltransferase
VTQEIRSPILDVLCIHLGNNLPQLRISDDRRQFLSFQALTGTSISPIINTVGWGIMTRILLFYLIRNSGHHTTAKAVESAIHLLDPNAETLCIDPLEHMHPHLNSAVITNLMFILKRTPELWDALYDSEKLEKLVRLFKGTVHRGSDSLIRVLETFNPTAVVATQAYPLSLITEIKRRRNYRFPLFGVVTDFRVHRFWSNGNGVTYIVPNADGMNRLVSLGIRREHIRDYGIPVAAEFSANSSTVVPGHGRHRVLVMGGSRGMGHGYSTIKSLDHSDKDFTIDVVTGLNRALGNRLASNRHDFQHPVRLRGHVKRMAPLMHKADLLIGKAGGLTCAEAMSAGLPLLIIHPLPGQELANTEELVAHGAALHLQRDKDVPAIVTMLLENPEILAMMRKRALELAKPSAALQTAEEILNQTRSSNLTSGKRLVAGRWRIS